MRSTNSSRRPPRPDPSGWRIRAAGLLTLATSLAAISAAVASAPPLRAKPAPETRASDPLPPPSFDDVATEPVPDGFASLHVGSLEALLPGDPYLLPTVDGAGTMLRLDARGQFPDGTRSFTFVGDPGLGSDEGATASIATRDGLAGGYVRPGGAVVTRLAAIAPGLQSLHAEGTDLGCGGGLVPTTDPDEGGVAENCEDSPLIQDALIVYNAAAAQALGGSSAAQLAILAAIATSNQSLKNSQLNNRIRPVRVQQVDFPASGSGLSQIESMTSGAGGAGIRALRNAWGADLVQLVSTFDDACGYGYIFNDNANLGYSIVAAGCVGGFTPIHEFGHNYGCCHAAGDGGGCQGGGYFPFSLGYRFIGASGIQRRTIMAYSPGDQIGYFSNPYLQFDGRPLGSLTPPGTDNARTIGLTCASISNFRCSVLGAPDCNGNQVPDPVDILDGTSLDCNFNLIPDECEPGIDCTPDQTVIYPADPDPRILDAFATAIDVGQRPTGDPSPYLAIGAYGDDASADNSGAAFVWRRVGAGWIQDAKLKSPVPRANGLFGWALSAFRRPAQTSPLPVVAERSFLAVGAYRQPGGTDEAPIPSQGAVYLFARDANTPAGQWPVARTIRPSDGLSNALFGYSVKMLRIGNDADDLLFTGAPKSNGRGAIFIHRIPARDATPLPNPRKLLFQQSVDGCDYGWSLAVDPLVVDPADPGASAGRRAVLVVGAPGFANDAGRVKCHERKLTANALFNATGITVGLPSDLAQANDRFGEAVAIADNLIAVGAPGRDNAQGAVFIFRRTGLNLYSLQQTISLGASAKPGDRFGAAVSLQTEVNGSVSLLVGAPRRDVSTVGGGLRIDAGATFLYRSVIGGSSFSFVREDIAFDPRAGDQFGFTVFQRAGERWMGAPFNDDQGLNSGKAYFLADPTP